MVDTCNVTVKAKFYIFNAWTCLVLLFNRTQGYNYIFVARFNKMYDDYTKNNITWLWHRKSSLYG